ncbi:hypothetical protein [Amycolatopsis sp. NBC_01480]|uniref:hypothetical protein n=1 Tax=Amycolatopsis sp. NBC_01480 TaxID=2903562 RepID=UPI002E2CB66C|nr:hypothetical protein [Amycolatopsis sp. NBC_01480]
MSETAAEGLASERLREAAATVRVNGQLAMQSPLDTALLRDVPVGSLADVLSAAVNHFVLYEGRGWDEAKINNRVDGTALAALRLADTILGRARD